MPDPITVTASCRFVTESQRPDKPCRALAPTPCGFRCSYGLLNQTDQIDSITRLASLVRPAHLAVADAIDGTVSFQLFRSNSNVLNLNLNRERRISNHLQAPVPGRGFLPAPKWQSGKHEPRGLALPSTAVPCILVQCWYTICR